MADCLQIMLAKGQNNLLNSVKMFVTCSSMPVSNNMVWQSFSYHYQSIWYFIKESSNAAPSLKLQANKIYYLKIVPIKMIALYKIGCQP